jgi:AraC family transcriptional regulator of adaptative response/methylated-DNA-[protein]-cysteine methyltransferase
MTNYRKSSRLKERVMNSVVAAKPPLRASEARWRAVSDRDRGSDGKFVYAVRTTGVYCRPSCPARLPLRSNVQFFDSNHSAEAAGFRACKRCRPAGPSASERHAAIIERACRLIDAADGNIELKSLAERVGLSPYHFHRLFKAATGLTPRAYAEGRKQHRMRASLQGGQRITAAVFDAGYGSASRFYEKATGALGMKPTSYRAGGRDAQIRFAVAETSLGTVLVAATERGVCAVEFGVAEELVENLQDRFAQARLVGADASFEKLVASVIARIEQPQRKSTLSLDVQGTAFQQRVWLELQKIPLGQTASYAEIAARIGQPRATRAVAQACGANRIAVLIPCHRVVRTDRSLSGYRWGIERKRSLLAKESSK